MTSAGISTAELELSKIAEALSPRLNGFISSENRYGDRQEPRFTVVAVLRNDIGIDTVLAVETETGISFLGYHVIGAVTRLRGPLDSDTYHAVASLVWADQMAGDYPIGKADFSTPGTITWVFPEDRYALPRTWEQLRSLEGTDIWFDEAFASRQN